MKPVWTAASFAGALALTLTLYAPAMAAEPCNCPPKAKPAAHVKKAAHKPKKHKRRPIPAPLYYEEEYRDEAWMPPPPPPEPEGEIWRDGYGKAYWMPHGIEAWAPPACPCPPHLYRGRGRLPEECRFDVWYGYNGRRGLSSGL